MQNEIRMGQHVIKEDDPIIATVDRGFYYHAEYGGHDDEWLVLRKPHMFQNFSGAGMHGIAAGNGATEVTLNPLGENKVVFVPRHAIIAITQAERLGSTKKVKYNG